MNYCPKCGDKLYDGSEFCMNCGFKLPITEKENDNTAPMPIEIEQTVTTDDTIEHTQESSITQIPKSKKKKIILISLIAVLIVAIAAGASWFFFLRATGTNFLNIEWNKNQTSVENVIIDYLDGKNVKYTKSGATIDTESDPYFGLGDDGELRIITKYNTRNALEKILVMVSTTGNSSIYDTVIGKMNRIFGSSTTNESAYDIKTTWSLEKTKIEARAYDFSSNRRYLIVFIEFNPR